MPFAAYARIGFTPGATSSADNSGLNTDNEVASTPVAVGFPSRVYQLFCYFSGNGATTTAQIVAWNTSLAWNARTASFTAPSGGTGSGQQTLNSGYSDGNARVASSGESYWIGFFRSPSLTGVWGVAASGTFQTKSSSSLDNFGSNVSCAAAGFPVCGNLQAFADTFGGDIPACMRGYPGYRKGRRLA